MQTAPNGGESNNMIWKSPTRQLVRRSAKRLSRQRLHNREEHRTFTCATRPWPSRKNCGFIPGFSHLESSMINVPFFSGLLLARPPRKVLLGCETFSGRSNSRPARKDFTSFLARPLVGLRGKSFTRTLGFLGRRRKSFTGFDSRRL